MLSPLPRRSDGRSCFAHPFQPYQPSPIGSSGRPAHRPFRGLLSVHSRYGLHTRAATEFRGPLTEGFSHFVTSMTAPVASGWSISPGGACTHWKAPPLHGAHPKETTMTTTKQIPATQNDAWGFWGTMNEHANAAWPMAMTADLRRHQPAPRIGPGLPRQPPRTPLCGRCPERDATGARPCKTRSTPPPSAGWAGRLAARPARSTASRAACLT